VVEGVVVLECLMLLVITVVDVEEAVVVGTGVEVVVEVEALLVI